MQLLKNLVFVEFPCFLVIYFFQNLKENYQHWYYKGAGHCSLKQIKLISNSWTMVCPPVRDGEWITPQTGGQNMVSLFYITFISVDLAQNEMFCAKASDIWQG